MKKIVVFFLFLLFFLGGFFTSETITKKKTEDIVLKQKQCQSQLQQALNMSKKDTKQNLCLPAQKEKALENIVESKVYFSPRISQLSATKSEITISLLGNAAMKADASDMVMKYTDNLKILEILPGTVFPSYPRKLSADGIITVTGIASLDSNGIKFGQPNQVFVTLIVEKMGDAKQKGIITVDKANTKAFLQGNSILDPNLTFEKVEF